MAWWNVYGQLVDDTQEGARLTENAVRLADYGNQAQYGDTRFMWDPAHRWYGGKNEGVAPGYVTGLLALRERVRSGQAKPYEVEQYTQWEAQARSIPTRDLSSLKVGWQGEGQGYWSGNVWQAGGEDWWTHLDPTSPDVGPIMLQLVEKLERGEATAKERQLFEDVYKMGADWNYRASVPQASDANPFGLGDNLMGALMMLSIGASGGLAAAPLAAGAGLTLASAGGLLAAAGGITGMLAEPLDSEAMRMAGLAMGAAGGVTSLASLLSNGLNSVSDVVKAVQKVYGTSQKGMALVQAAQQGGNNPAVLAQAQRQSQAREVGSNSQTLSAAESRTQGRSSSSQSQASSAGTPGGGSMDWTQLSGVLSGVIGLAGAGLSLADVARYMNQLKDQYGEQQEIKDLIDQAYTLAKQRYETYYNQTQRQDAQSQEAYQKSVERADTFYNQTQGEQQQRQAAYQEQRQQIAEDRAEQQEVYRTDRQKVMQTFDQRQQALMDELNQQKAIYGESRARQITNFDQRQQQLLQNRQKELQTFDQEYQRKLQRDDRQLAEIDQERGMGMEGWRASYNIGANLSDPTKIKEGAQQIYRPLSDLAVQRVSDEVSADRSLRGLTGPGQYGDYLAAKAYAPFENQLWETALNTYMGGQRAAIDAYGNRTLARSGDYRMTSTPQFTTTEQWTDMTLPNYTDLAQYAYGNRPVYEQQSQQNVPGTVRYDPRQAPGVPGAIDPNDAPGIERWTPTPYAPFGTTPQTGRGQVGGVGSGIQTLMNNLGRLLPGIFAGGKALSELSNYDRTVIEQELQRAMQDNPDLFGFGGSGANPNFYSEPVGPGMGWDAGGYGIDMYAGGSQFFDESMGSLPYDNWSYNPDWGFEPTW